MFWELKGLNVISFQTTRSLSAHFNSALQCTLSHSICEIWMPLIKGITVHFFLLHWQKWIILNHTRLEIKKKKNSNCLVVASLLPLDSSVFSSRMKWLRQIEPFEVYVLFHTSSLTEAAVEASAPSFVQIPREGGSNRSGRNTRTSRITYPWIRLECSWRDAFRSLPYSRERLEVTALKYSSLGAINSS